MNYNHPFNGKPAGVIRFSCGALFFLFSFFFLYFLQGEALAVVQHVLSRGVTHYNPFVGALVISAVLQLLQWTLVHLVRFPARWHALSYVPSFLLLALLSDLYPTSSGEVALGCWQWLAPVLFACGVLVVPLVRRLEYYFSADWGQGLANLLLPNYLIFSVFMFLVGALHQPSDIQLFEYKTERLVQARRYEEALEVGRKSLATSPRLMQLRLYAMARLGRLGEQLLDYPIPRDASGLVLLSDTDTVQRRFVVSQVYGMLGVKAGKTVASPSRYLELALTYLSGRADSLSEVARDMIDEPDSVQALVRRERANVRYHQRLTLDYVMADALLRKDLPRYQGLLRRHVAIDSLHTDSVRRLPRIFAEAALMVDSAYVDTAVAHRYRSYVEMRDTLHNAVVRRNLTRRKFGDTYWWYFDFH